MEQQNIRNKHSILQLYDTILPVLAEHIHRNLAPVLPLFHDFKLERLIDTWTKAPDADPDEEISVENGNVQQLGLKLRLEGFMKPGVETFDLAKDLLFKLERSSYTVGPGKHSSWLEKGYLQKWETSEYKMIAEKWSEELVDELMQRLEKLT
ncbi:MAG: hypothetical protein LPK07_10765 [Hymenobacteraceae bacterium]|nr:hypothetical protein [Hymenobacteraceae bacterium]MDX5482150.1 hypothetical protein [Hymenobacteraceae bacterium]